MIELDAKGLSCPQPLMMVNDAMAGNPGETIVVEVDTATPRDNILRLAARKKRQASVEEVDDIFRITIE
ncbi:MULTISPECIES: sulfurtransferase TusA family protein [unclassified Adlercreutzia]|uniref:sulfurtransferase TusA family protein n=1 Tax=unclassified Adlercreutzia TaxID=2636013 RepID=UPI0013ED69CC|nr:MULTISPECIES: sulfurtransferase TusA family protein [unclassified Adlercreutzia]